MKKYGLFAVAFVMSAFMAASAWAQSSKFAATWNAGGEFVQAQIFDSSITPVCTGSGGQTGAGTEASPCILAVVHFATIRIPQQKDLLIGLSSEIGLITETLAKGKNSLTTLGSATASASVVVTLQLREADGSGTGALVQTAAPGPVTFAARLQEIKIGSDADTDVVISLALSTTAAHHFNFIGVDLDSGDYDVVAVFDLSAFVAVSDLENTAKAKVILGPRMLTVQEVRAVQGGLVEFTPTP